MLIAIQRSRKVYIYLILIDWGRIDMVKIMVGKKGSGKTKQMVNTVNDHAVSSKGSVIFINNDRRLEREINYRIRVVSAEDYKFLGNIDEFTGFILGIICSDHDIETIYIDSITKHADISLDNVEEFVKRLDKISEDYEIDFVVSVSAEPEEVAGITANHEVLN